MKCLYLVFESILKLEKYEPVPALGWLSNLRANVTMTCAWEGTETRLHCGL